MENIESAIISKKCVLIIDNTQPTGIIANTASVLSITLGKQIDGIVSHDIYDKQGEKHLGITQMPIPILGTSRDRIKEIRKNILSLKSEDLVLVDFSNIAQQSKTYDNYESVMLSTDENEIEYVGIAICGDKKIVNKATGNLSLIR